MDSPKMKYAHLFVDAEDQYLYIKTIGAGAQARAQLCTHVQTGKLVVRKVSRKLLDAAEKEKEDPERVLFYLQSQAQKRGVRPNIAHLISAADIPASVQRPGTDTQPLWHRVSYFDYYNGGNLGNFLDTSKAAGVAIPAYLILKMIREVAEALSFMYSVDYVLHGDLHVDNIFLEEECASKDLRFVLGDFGWATYGKPRAANRYGLVVDVFFVWEHVQKMIAMLESDPDDPLERYLGRVVEPELRKLAFGPRSSLPDFTTLLKLLSAAPSVAPPETSPLKRIRDRGARPLPLFYGSWEEAAAAGIDGPWHVAEVVVDPYTGKLSVLRTSPRTYHQPEYVSYHDAKNMYEWFSLS